MAKDNYEYKTIKISAQAHQDLTELAGKEGLSLKDYISKIMDTLKKNKLDIQSLVELSSGGLKDIKSDFKKETDRVIKFLGALQREVLIPTKTNSFNTLQGIKYIVDHLDYEKEKLESQPEEKQTPVQEKKQEETNINSLQPSQVQQLKIEKERLEIDLRKCVEELETIIAPEKLVKSPVGSSKTRKFSEEEIDKINKMIENVRRHISK